MIATGTDDMKAMIKCMLTDVKQVGPFHCVHDNKWFAYGIVCINLGLNILLHIYSIFLISFYLMLAYFTLYLISKTV